MATFNLINTLQFGTSKLKSGSIVDSNCEDSVAIIAAGGILVATALSATLDAVALAVRDMWAQGKGQDQCDAAMLAGYGAYIQAFAVAHDTVGNTTATNGNESAHTHPVAANTPAITGVTLCGHASFLNPIAAELISVVNDVLLADGVQAIAAQPDYPRKLQVRITDGDGSINAGTVTLVGVAIDGSAVTQVIPLTGGTRTVITDAVYATLTSATVAALAGHGAGDNIGIGVGAALGLPIPAGATAVAVTKTCVDSANETVAGVDATARSVAPTSAANAARDFDFYFKYVVTPVQAAHDHGAATGAGAAHTHVQAAHTHTLA